MESGAIKVSRSWRAEISGLIAFVAAVVASVALSRLMPWSVIEGRLFTAFGQNINLWLPLFCLLPFFILCFLLLRMYDYLYIIDSRGIESRVGIVSLRLRVALIRYEDIRLIEVKQSVLGRLLNFGNIEIGTAAREDIEVVLEGVDAPSEIQEMLQAEREKRRKLATQRKDSHHISAAAAIT